jgi:hypothetical protein
MTGHRMPQLRIAPNMMLKVCIEGKDIEDNVKDFASKFKMLLDCGDPT